MIRALVDPNVFISYLLGPDNDTPPSHIFKAAFFNRFVLLLPISVVEEFSQAISAKPYLSARIDQVSFDHFLSALLNVAERSERLDHEPAALVRDVKDDYLLAHAVVLHADYLVIGDRDLLALASVFPVKIVTPAEFIRVLDEIDPPEE